MLEAGFLDEMRRLTGLPGFDRESPAMRYVGYRQALEYLAGETNYAVFRDKAIAATRQLAKRQITWLRSMKDEIRAFDPYTEAGLRDAKAYALSLDWDLQRPASQA